MADEYIHGFRARLDYLMKHNHLFSLVFRKVMSLFMRFWGFFVPINNKMIIFTAHGRMYNDSPRAIYEYMLKTGKFKDFIMVWGLEDTSVKIPGDPIKVKADTLKYFKYTFAAKYWITCVNIERSLHFKKKGCRYLNTWHGCSINHCGNAVPGRKDFDFSNIDYMCYESEYHKEILIRDFLCREDAMIPTGLPRNDTLYKTTADEVISLKKKMGLPLNKKILLYTPTWRDSTDMGKTYTINPPLTVKYWEKELKDDYIMLMRIHAYTTNILGIEFNDFSRNMSLYPDINDLFKVADVLISDYSSCIADYSILERPIICFGYDYEEYCKIRGLYIDMEKDMPSGVKRTEDEVIKHIKTMDYAAECKLTKELIKDRLTNIGGRATEICIQKIFEK